MVGFAGNYSHVVGDRFIFKGGVRWPTSCYQWKVTWSGSPTLYDYYGVDTNWFCGLQFKRPLFDFERRSIHGWQYGAGFLFEGAKNVTIDNLEFANHATPLAKDGIGTWLCATIAVFPGENITLTNCVVRDWWQPNFKETVNGVVVTRIEAGTSGGGAFHGHYASNLRAINCEFHQMGSETINGNSLWNITHVEGCHIHHTATAVMSAATMRNNYIHHLLEPSDLAAHSNAMLCYDGTQATGNLVHDICARAQVLYFTPGYSSPGKALAQSNTVFNVAQPCIAIDTNGKNDPGASMTILNNTLVGPGPAGTCIRAGDRANGPLGALDFRGNRLISTRPLSVEVPVNTLTHSGNTTNTIEQAAAAGLSPANYYGFYNPPVVVPPPVVDPIPTNSTTITNWITMTNWITATNWVIQEKTNYTIIPILVLTNRFEGKMILEGIWRPN